MTKQTHLLPLSKHKLKDREDIIKWYVNRYEDSPGVFKNEIPEYKETKPKVDLSIPAALHAFKHDISGFVLSLRP